MNSTYVKFHSARVPSGFWRVFAGAGPIPATLQKGAMPSKIEWTDETWNPVAGCSKVSDGCRNCYAIRDAYRLAANPNPMISAVDKGLTILQNHRTTLNWTGKMRLIVDRLEQPLRWKKQRRVFVNSMSDLWHKSLPL